MAGLWQRTGNVTVTNGSKTVTGFGTKWKTGVLPIQKGHTFYGPDNAAYEVDTVVSDESILLVDAYRGGTLANQAYRIDITRTSTISQFAADLASLVGKYRTWFDGMMTWLTGSGDVSILNPDTGANTTIPSWKKVTSEGEGQATRAKAEADKAAASAASAAAAALAARLPTPDVSIPFTTDGRMTHGKGAPVLVGTTPVAQLVTYERLGSQTKLDKSGRLVTVPAGEMAIERQGLAIFGQSVNLAAPSINWAASANAAAAWTHGAADAAGWITVSGAGSTGATEGSYKDFTVPTMDIPHTFSLDILKTVGLNVKLRTYGHGQNGVDMTITEAAVSGSGAADVVDMGAFWRVELTWTFTNTTRIFRIYPFGSFVGSTGSMSYRRVQLEAQPFATPYIENATSAQTTRPATTRCDLPWLGNMQPLTDWQELTISFEFDTAGLPASAVSHTIFTQGGGVAQHFMARLESNGFLRFYRSGSPTHQLTPVARRRYKLCYRINRNVCDLFVDGAKVGSTITASPNTPGMPDLLRLGHSQTPDRCLNGHLRNINIWNSPLTDAQCVAASS
ncbi:LamG-like jellyroll fold domain-containing protein [Aeromonas caviae]|uniref:LamG-like jellyroll fold domain-containing protein n=1 Tax=Aeromonas caviae TaxID=648 RepID=A0ABU5WAG3_AERCA|nr:LamG-like jellyroll fold domain-containing protein [Aeromonas caviae]MEA9437855.1 LamG-like jellyroll fold domain-containing protein [Aeromonas caviae]